MRFMNILRHHHVDTGYYCEFVIEIGFWVIKKIATKVTSTRFMFLEKAKFVMNFKNIVKYGHTWAILGNF